MRPMVLHPNLKERDFKTCVESEEDQQVHAQTTQQSGFINSPKWFSLSTHKVITCSHIQT